MKIFDPNAAASSDSGIFGLPFSVEEAQLVLLPIPWEVTTSYGVGTAKAPQAILQASKQVDLFDLELGNFFEQGIAMMEESNQVQLWNSQGRKLAQEVIASGGSHENPQLRQAVVGVNALSSQLNHYVYTQTKQLLAQNKQVGLVGGDHSTPFGMIQAFLEQYPQMGILHFDAHADLRKAFEGFEYSHASIMYNVLTQTPLARLVQVGIRDLCEEEFECIQHNADRVITFYDTNLTEQKMHGKTWGGICEEIVQELPQQVYISFDIDGLDPRFCPHTGTPVPGGLDYVEALLLIKKVVQSGRSIIGFDLNEVSPGVDNLSTSAIADTAAQWDANVGARLLYKLCGWVLK
jgi:agmatinase